MTHRAYSFLEIKAVDEERRQITGWASRPETDRHGDVVEPLGMIAPRGTTPLLLDHDHKRAVGTVTELKPNRDGVRFVAKIAKIATAGPLQQLCDDAWAMVRSGLRAATSIGFKPLDAEPNKDGGWRYKKWSLLELSLVSVPACEGATIDQVKAADRALLAKRQPARVVKLGRPISTALDAELARDVTPTKGLTAIDDMLIRSIATSAKTADDCLAQLDQRISRLEQGGGARKSVVDMSLDEFREHMAAQRTRLLLDR